MRLHPGFFLLLLAAACGGSLAGEVARRASGGSTIEQGPDGWLQRVLLHGVAQPGLAGLRQAFARQLVSIECPSSQAFEVQVTSQREQAAGKAGVSSSITWSRRQQCGTPVQGADGGSDGGGGATVACSVAVPAVGDSLIVVQQPNLPGSQAPEPCILTVQPGTSPVLVLASALGMLLLLRGQQWARSRSGVAVIRASCLVLPLLSALLNAALLASLAVVSTAAVEWVISQLPVQPPKELWGTAVVAIAALAGIVTGLSLICACVAMQMRGLAVAAAPWTALLLGWALVCSNSGALNWTVRLSCLCWLILSRLGKAPGKRAAAGAKRAL